MNGPTTLMVVVFFHNQNHIEHSPLALYFFFQINVKFYAITPRKKMFIETKKNGIGRNNVVHCPLCIIPL